MNFLFISGSSIPTKCGVGKFTDKLINLLISDGLSVGLLANENQKISLPNTSKHLSYNVKYIDLKLSNLAIIIKHIKNIKPDKINIQYNSIELGRSAFTIFLAIIIKLLFPKIQLQVMLHEFSNYTLLGKTKYIIAALVADKVFFSDRRQMESAISFSRKLIKNKSHILPLGANVYFTNNNSEPKLSNPNEKLHIAFHGFIQPKNGIEYLLLALDELQKTNSNFILHILGDFKLIINYDNLNEEIIQYQKKWLSFINSKLADNVIIHGDIDPSSPEFKKVLSDTEIAIIPDVDGLTIRRSSFWNIFMQSQNIMFASFNQKTSDAIFSNFMTYLPKDQNNLKDKILEYQSLTKAEKYEIWKKQSIVRKEMSMETLKPKILELLLK
jgi:glycosyltransferase involved in cell wall biosynthesis